MSEYRTVEKRETLRSDMTFEEFISYCKKNPDLVRGTAEGRKVLEMISRGDSKRLSFWWKHRIR